MVLAGDRAFWASDGASNLTEYTELLTASLRTRRVNSVDYQSIYNQGLDHIVPPVTDGRGVYYWSSPEDATPGPIYRYDRRANSRRLTRTIGSVAALGAGEEDGRSPSASDVRLRRRSRPGTQPGESPSRAAAHGSCRGGIWVVNANGRGTRRLTTVRPQSGLVTRQRAGVRRRGVGESPLGNRRPSCAHRPWDEPCVVARRYGDRLRARRLDPRRGRQRQR